MENITLNRETEIDLKSGYDILWVLFLIDVAINLLAFVGSVVFKNYKNFDLVGSLSYIVVCSVSLAFSSLRLNQIIQSSCVLLWALRLGIYLFQRALRRGDKRFEKYEQNWLLIIVPFALQIFWVFIMLFPTMILNLIPTGADQSTTTVTICNYIGWPVWLIGFIFEVVSDYQKSQFSQNPENKGKFISHGLWSVSRHPNYFGEVLLWFGLYISIIDSIDPVNWWQYLSGLSVVFIYLLLRYVSGINMLEANGLDRWGDDPKYQEYISKVPVFVPFVCIYK